MVNQDGNKNHKPVKSSTKQPKYRPPGRKSPGKVFWAMIVCAIY
uniref:Cyclin-dependent kinase F-4 isoform X1 n=1 Tax=Rhizophora mucronata TaxID=61149 RepID=A0A2P2MHM6_RHIMU